MAGLSLQFMSGPQCPITSVSAPGLRTTMIRFDQQQRAALSETLRELANLAATALVLGQFVTGQPLSWRLILMGAAVWVAFVGYGLVLERRRR